VKLIGIIRDETVDAKVSLATVLRRAKVLASMLGEENFKAWVDNELEGYGQEADLPSYRCFKTLSLGTFSGSFGRVVKNVAIPILNLPKDVRSFAQEMIFSQGVRELERLTQDADSSLRHQWPAELIMLAREYVKMQDGSLLVDAWHPVQAADIVGILDTIRNRLLEFLLQLQEVVPDDAESDTAIENIPTERVTNIFHVTILGDQNVVAAGSNISQHVEQEMESGNIDSLLGYLRSLQVPEEDLRDLQAALEEDAKCSEAGLGPRVKQWLGMMTTKAAQGIWRVAVRAAPTLLAKAVLKFLGL